MLAPSTTATAPSGVSNAPRLQRLAPPGALAKPVWFGAMITTTGGMNSRANTWAAHAPE